MANSSGPCHSRGTTRETAVPESVQTTRLPWPLVVLLLLALAGGIAETVWVTRREIIAVNDATGKDRRIVDLEWAYRSSTPAARARVEQLLELPGGQEIYWIYPESAATAPQAVQRYLAASVLYPRPVLRRELKHCPQTPIEPLPEVVDECTG